MRQPWIVALVVVYAVGYGVGCGSTHGIAASECHGLSLGDCRLTAGCVPDRCAGCGCDLAYRGCLGAGETPAMCPALGCPSGICCSSELACAPSTGTCEPPGASFGCGACNTDPGNCTVDADCKPQGATMVCDPIACSCGGHLACVLGCVGDAGCGEGQTCDLASARCIARACTGDAGCPSNFRCPAHTCVRMTCTEDVECDGYCVDGSCFAELGSCQLPVP